MHSRALTAVRSVAIGLALMLAAACSMQSARPPEAGAGRTTEPVAAGNERPRRSAERNVAATNTAETNAAVADEEAEASDEVAEEDPIAAILAERRRGDYPEIELQEYGFTITEQVRIGSDARSDYERALVLLRQDRYAEGIAILERVVDAVRDATVPYIDLGIAYSRSGNPEQAETALTTAMALSPDNPVVHNELGILYRQTGRFAEARSSYEQALAVFADFHYARRNLAVLCDLYLADLECALQNYTAYLDSVGSDSEVEIWIADIENRLASRGAL